MREIWGFEKNILLRINNPINEDKDIVGGGGLPLAPGFRRTPNAMLKAECIKGCDGDPGAHPLFGAGSSVVCTHSGG
jgi:hypothetical protein